MVNVNGKAFHHDCRRKLEAELVVVAGNRIEDVFEFGTQHFIDDFEVANGASHGDYKVGADVFRVAAD